MSASPGTVAAPPPRLAGIDLPTLGLVAGAACLLLVRLRLPALGEQGRLVGLAAILLAVLASSVLVPVPRSPARIAPAVALLLGLAGIGLALVASGRPTPAPIVAWGLPLALLAAVSEEAVFRRAMYGALERRSARLAVVATAVAFAVLHVPLYGVAVFPVDLGAGLLLSWQRWATGSWTVPAATHGAANLLMVALR